MTAVSKTLVGALALALLGSTGIALQAQDKMAAPADKMDQADTMAPAKVIAQQSFLKAEKPVSGSYKIKMKGDQKLLVLSSDFRTSESAPDLKVVFSPSATPLAQSKPPAYPLEPGSYTLLAPLKSASGTQTYVIPASLDVKAQGSLLIWCEEFNATMAWAPLKP